MKYFQHIFFSIICCAASLSAQSQTVGLFFNDSLLSNPGYSLFSPLSANGTFLINNDGQLVHKWDTNPVVSASVYLLENGDLLRCADPGANNTHLVAGGDGGLIERLDWEGNVLWQFHYNDSLVRQHHDIEPMPNGNILILAWEYKTAAEAIAAGRDSTFISQNSVWPEHIIEIEPNDTTGGKIVWEWRSWDHLVQDFDSTKPNYGVIAENPGKIDLNHDDPTVEGADYSVADFMHANSVDYNAELDQIIVSVRLYDEFWVIDHNTTTEQAAGEKGDLLYRWGNPGAYDAPGEKILYAQHDAQWIPEDMPGAGNIIVFSNGGGRPGGPSSSIEEITPPLLEDGTYKYTPGQPFGPDSVTWRYAKEGFYSQIISGVQRQRNGNTLICSGVPGEFFEVTPQGETVWKYVNPVTSSTILHRNEVIPSFSNGTRFANMVFRVERYEPSYPAFAGRDLTPMGTIELDPTSVQETELIAEMALLPNFPNPFYDRTTLAFTLAKPMKITLKIFDIRGREVDLVVKNAEYGAGLHKLPWNAGYLSAGVYFVELRAADFRQTQKMLLLHEI